MTRAFKLERGAVQIFARFRQMVHDEQLSVGSKIKHGSGAKWTVIEVLPEPFNG